MYYLQIGLNGKFHLIKNREEAARVYASYEGFKKIVAEDLGGNRWEVKSTDWRGNARFSFCCYGKTEDEAVDEFYSRIEKKMSRDTETLFLDEQQYVGMMIPA